MVANLLEKIFPRRFVRHANDEVIKTYTINESDASYVFGQFGRSVYSPFVPRNRLCIPQKYIDDLLDDVLHGLASKEGRVLGSGVYTRSGSYEKENLFASFEFKRSNNAKSLHISIGVSSEWCLEFLFDAGAIWKDITGGLLPHNDLDKHRRVLVRNNELGAEQIEQLPSKIKTMYRDIYLIYTMLNE